MHSLMNNHCLPFEIQIIKNGFYGPDKLSGLSRNWLLVYACIVLLPWTRNFAALCLSHPRCINGSTVRETYQNVGGNPAMDPVLQIREGFQVTNPRKLATWPNKIYGKLEVTGDTHLLTGLQNPCWHPAFKSFLEHCWLASHPPK